MAGTLIGRVLRADGSPVPHADVLISADERQLQGEIFAVRETLRLGVPVPASRLVGRTRQFVVRESTDPTGRFRIELDAQQLGALANPLVAVVSGLTDVAVSRGLLVGTANHDLGDLVLPVGAELRVRLVKPEGDPVFGGRVSVELPSEKAARGRLEDEGLRNLGGWLTMGWSREDGVADLVGFPAGEASVEVEVEGWQDMRLDGVVLSVGQLTDLGSVTLDAGRTIEGIALDPDRHPVVGMQVGVRAEHGPSMLRRDQLVLSGRENDWAVLDDQGRFRVSGLGVGTYTLELSVPGYTTARVTGVAAGSRDVQLLLRRPAEVLVTLLDGRTAKPVEGAEFSATVAEDAGNESADPLQLVVTTGVPAGLAPGLYRVAGASELGTRLSVRAEGYPSQSIDVPGLAPESTLAVTIRLDPGFVLAGQVVDFENRPILGADVQAAARDGPALGSETRRVETDAEGRFKFAGIVTGKWTCWVSASGFLSAPSAELELGHRDVDDMLFRLAPESTIEGRVLVPTGEPLPAAVVLPALVESLPAPRRAARSVAVLVESDTNKRPRSGSCSDDGAYRLGGLGPGIYLLTASMLSDQLLSKRLDALISAARDPTFKLPADVTRIVIGLGEHRTLDLFAPRPATLTGRVIANGAAAAQAKVAVWLAHEKGWSALAQTACDEAGDFTIEGLAAGDVLVAAVADSEPVPTSARLTLSEGQTANASLVFTGSSARALVIDAVSRQPLAGVAVNVTWFPPRPPAPEPSELSKATFDALRDGSLRHAPLVSDATGVVVLQHLLDGEYTLSVAGRDWLTKTSPHFLVGEESTGDEIVLEVSAGGVVEGAVRFALGGVAGEGSDHFEVGLYTPGENVVHASARVREGTYRLQGLHGGSYDLRVLDRRRGGGYLQSQPVKLEDEQHLRMDIILGQ